MRHRRSLRTISLVSPFVLAVGVCLAGAEAHAGAFTLRARGPATADAAATPDAATAPTAAPTQAEPANTPPAAAPAPNAEAPPEAAGEAAAPPPDAAPAPDAADAAAAHAAEAPPPAPAPEAVPEEDDPTYASSKDAGQALSGAEVEDRETTVETVGEVKEAKKKKGLSHEKTGILGVGFAYGVSLITAGDKFCGEFSASRQDPDSRKPLCVGATPPAIDILAGFGASKRIDVVVGVRVNLMPRDFNTKDCPNPDDAVCNEGKGLFNTKIGIGVMPGIRIYGKETNKIVKFGGQVQVMYMYENFDGYRSRPDGPSEDADPDNREDEAGVSDHFVGLRGGPILQIDPHHNFGISIAPAMLPGFRPKAKSEVDAGWFEIGFEATLGFEARFP